MRLYRWLERQPKVDIQKYERNIKRGEMASVSVQGDGECHVWVKGVYEKVNLRELKQLLQGKYDFVERGCYSDEAKETFKKLAEILPKVRRWIVTAYPKDNGIIVENIEQLFRSKSLK